MKPRGWETSLPLDEFLAEIRAMSSGRYQPAVAPLTAPDNGGGRAAKLARQAGGPRRSVRDREIACDVARAAANGWRG